MADQRSGAPSEKRKKSRRRRLLYWLLIDLAVAAGVAALLLYRPSGYRPVVLPPGDPNSQRVHPYLHRDLGSGFYNGAQKQRPFEMVVLDQHLNEAIAQLRWANPGEEVSLSAPEILFTPGRITLMGTADVKGAAFVVTVELGPQLDERGYLNLVVEKVKIGAMNITPLAKMVGRKMYQERLELGPVNMEDLGTRIVASLLNEQPFDPVMDVDEKRVRLKGFDITQGRLIAQFVPAK